MDFELSEQHKMLRAALRDFAEKEIAPLTERAEREEKFPIEWWEKAAALGYIGLTVSEKYGGAGAGLLAAILLAEEMARVNAGLAVVLSVPVEMLPAIEKYGTEQQKQKFLVPAARGEAITAMALTEPNAGSDLAAIQTMAHREGDVYVINGVKEFVTNAGMAHWMLTLVYVDKAKGLRGTRLAIIERGMEGIGLRKLDKVCVRSSETFEVTLDNVRVPADNFLGGNVSFRDAIDIFDRERCYSAAKNLGICQAAYEATLSYAKERKAFGQPIANFQAIRFKITDMATLIEAARLLTYYGAWLCDQGRPFIKEASMAKVFTANAAERICYDAVRIQGGYGLMMDSPVQRYWRDMGLSGIGGGTIEMQQLRIAKEIGLSGRAY